MRLVTLGVLLWASQALATVYDTFGFGPRAAAMGGAMTAEARDFTAVSYNPALLVERKDVDFGFSFQFNRMANDKTGADAATDPATDLARPLCPSIATIGPDGKAVSAPNPRCADLNASDTVGYSLGLLFPLGGKVRNRVALGLGIYIPSQRLLRVLAPDTSTPFWYHFQSHSERIVIHVGLGVKIFDWLTVGLGAQALADLIGLGANVDVDLFNKTVTSGSIDSHLATRVSPVIGIQVHPIERLRFGVTYRAEMSLHYHIPAKVNLQGIGTLSFSIDGDTHYTPHTVAFGAAWDITRDFTVALDGEWQHWSAAPSPYVDLTIGLSGDTLKALGLDNAFDINSPHQKPGFIDTVGARLGLEYRLTERFSARAGGFFRPTMVPKQTAPGSNILDADTVGVSVGVGFNFPDPLEIFASPINIDVATQAQVLLPREAIKEPTDPVPSYSYSAKVYGATIAIRYDF